MPYRIEREGRILALHIDGEFDMDDARSARQEIADRSAEEEIPASGVLIVDSSSSFNPSNEELREVVDLMKHLSDNVAERIALVVGRDLHYGLGRIVQAHLGDTHAFHTFRSVSDAKAWLGE